MKIALDKPIDVQRGNVCVEQMMCAGMLGIGMDTNGNGITRYVHLGNALMHNHCSCKINIFSIFQKLLKRFIMDLITISNYFNFCYCIIEKI